MGKKCNGVKYVIIIKFQKHLVIVKIDKLRELVSLNVINLVLYSQHFIFVLTNKKAR
jgi:hypothetical protein